MSSMETLLVFAPLLGLVAIMIVAFVGWGDSPYKTDL